MPRAGCSQRTRLRRPQPDRNAIVRFIVLGDSVVSVEALLGAEHTLELSVEPASVVVFASLLLQRSQPDLELLVADSVVMSVDELLRQPSTPSIYPSSPPVSSCPPA